MFFYEMLEKYKDLGITIVFVPKSNETAPRKKKNKNESQRKKVIKKFNALYFGASRMREKGMK